MENEERPAEIVPVSSPVTEASSPSAAQPEGSVADELNELGKKLVTALKAAWESPERKQLEREISTGVQSISQEIDRGLEQVRSSIKTGEVRQQVERAAEQARPGDVLEEFRTGLVQGLRELNTQLDNVIQSLQNRPPASGGGSTSHQVPIDMGAEEPPAPPIEPETDFTP